MVPQARSWTTLGYVILQAWTAFTASPAGYFLIKMSVQGLLTHFKTLTVIVVPGGGIGGNCPPNFSKFGQISNFSGSDKKIFG